MHLKNALDMLLAKYTVDMDNISSCRGRVEEAADEDLSLRDMDYLQVEIGWIGTCDSKGQSLNRRL